MGLDEAATRSHTPQNDHEFTLPPKIIYLEP